MVYVGSLSILIVLGIPITEKEQMGSALSDVPPLPTVFDLSPSPKSSWAQERGKHRPGASVSVTSHKG